MKKLRRLSALLVSGLFVFPLFAQQPENWDAFSQKLDITAYAGRQFRVKAAVKVLASGPGSEGALWVRIDNKDGKTGFFDNMYKRPIKTPKWKLYKIEGKIDDNAKWLLLGGRFQENGIFNFDDFQLEIKDGSGKWEKQELVNAGFETDSILPWKFFRSDKKFSRSIQKSAAYEKNNSLEIIGKGFIVKQAFGNNGTAGRFVKANGIKIYYEEYGSGEPLLLLHGNSQCITNFSHQIQEFQKHYHVIAVDTRGHGKTGDQIKRYSYDLFAEDMNALLDKLHLDSVNIVGWSDGGNTGLIMAMKYPKKVKKLVTMGAVVFIDSTVVTQQVLDIINKSITDEKEPVTKEAKDQFKKTKLLLEEPNYKFENLEIIRCPVLVMAGEHDIVKPGHSRGIAAHIAGAELYISPNQTHYLPEENAGLFNQKVLEFLQKQ